MNETKNILLKLFILLTCGVGWSSGAWAQSFPVAGKVYTIKARFTNGSGDLYLTNSSSTLTFPKIVQNNASQWIAEATGNATYPWRFKSVVDPTKYLNGSESSGISNTASTFAVNTCNDVAGTYHLYSNLSGVGNRNVGTWASNDSRTGFGKSGNGGCYGGGHSNSNWSTDYEIVENFLLGTNVNINFVDANGDPLPSIEIKYTKSNGSTETITTNTYNFGNVYCPMSVFSSANKDKRIVNAVFESGTITFTIADYIPEWYVVNHNYNHANKYLSTDYVSNGHVAFGSTYPTNYAGIWKIDDVTGEGALSFANAKYNDSKVLTVVGGNNAQMDDVNAIRTSAVYLVNQVANGQRFRFPTVANPNKYLGMSSLQVEVRDVTNDGSVDLTLTRVPTMGKNVTIVKENYIPGVVFKYNTQCVDADFLALGDVTNQDITNEGHFDFHNMPYLASLFTAENLPTTKRLSVQFNEDTQTLTLAIIDLPMIIHRQHATFDQLASTASDKKPSSKFIQEGQGLIDHPYAADFTDDKGYTANDRKIQNTSVFHITKYTTKGGTTTVALPHTRTGGLGSINKYQRIYDYLTERPLDEGIVSGMSDYTMYSNGYARTGSLQGSFTVTLPSDKDEICIGVDDSEFNNYSTDGEGNLSEPSLSMRTIIHVVSAEKMASALVTKGGEDKWWEEKTYIVPNVKRGSATHKNKSDLLPLDMPFTNYWIYGNSNNLMRIVNEDGGSKNDRYNTLSNNISFVVEGDAAEYINVGLFKSKSETGLDDPLDVMYNHFIYYNIKDAYKTDDYTRAIPAGKQAIIKVYAHDGQSGTKYQLAKFTLNFQADCEPIAITSVVGNPTSARSREYFDSQQMAEVASLTFSEKEVNNSNHYPFPLDPTRTSYAFSTSNAFGGYRITKQAYGMTVHSVSLYERNIKENSTSLAPPKDDYYLYIDAAEAPGQVASIPLDGNLCSGTRLFFYGWLNSQNPFEHASSTAASVILELVGRKTENNVTKEVVLATYLPGIVSDAAYTPNGEVVRSVQDGRTASSAGAHSSSYTIGDHTDPSRIAAWQSIGFSYLLTESGFDGFELRIINNCFSTAGGDYSLDDFRVFVNPPKGNVDFTTPLCSDKVRHAKIHAEYDMLKNISGVNENSGADMYVTCCFLEASVFDENTKINDESIFVVDAQGNHNLKGEYSTGDNLTTAKALINAAFGKALVGTRELSAGDKANHGFHVYAVSPNYESIEEYAYQSSLVDKVYREEVGGIRRIVFKEDVVRGEQELLPDGRWPHMRPSTTYYLVFSPLKATKGDGTSVDIDNHSAATDIFRIHESCSFFGKFKTKDPMHVILDNADIEADLPIKAVCHGESTAFQFNMPTLKLNKPIVDEAYCISDQNLNGKMVPESQGTHHYKYEPILNGEEVKGVITNLPYDWWLGGTLNGTTYRGTIEAYNNATHPTRTYSGPKDIAHKQDNAPVKIAQAMTDFRFFYPDFGKEGNTDWTTVVMKPYNPETGYGLLNSEIETIKDFVNAGIILLHRDTYNMPLTYEEAEELQLKELNDMMEKEMNDNILDLALVLNSDPAVAALLPLKALEGTVLDKLSLDGKKRLTFEEFGNFTRDQLVDIAGHLQTQKSKLTELTSEQINAMPEGDLRRVVESALRELPDDEMLGFAKDYFPNIGHEKRAYLVVRALNILSRETVAKLPEADQQNTTKVRAKLREQMISIFSAQQVEVLRKMWSDVSAKLTEEERAALLKDELHPETPKDPATMDAAGLAVLVEDGLAQLTNNVINDLQGDRYVHFTLVPIMPSQDTFVDEPYIFCPEPRGVKVRITSHEPKMLDGFADMPYPEDMENVPVRLGLKQISESKASAAKTLRIPVRGLKQAAKNGIKAVKLDVRTGYYNEIFLVETDDPQYQQTETTGMAEAKNSAGVYTRMIGTIEGMIATYPTAGNKTPDNYLVVKFKDDMNFREGYTYRVGINFMEHDSEGHETISCPGEMRLDMKIVPEYQKWTASVNSDWTDDQNWARADRDELNADNAATGSVIAGSTDITVAANYPTNEANKKSSSFVPMYFTNVLVDGDTDAPVLYTVTAASRGEKKFLQGLTSDDATQAQHIYDMEVAPSTGAWHDDNNYECTLFGTYVANGITFKPGSQLINAQHLTYNKAWVEYELQAGRWYTLSSPLQNTFAGEWYSPTDGGKQLTPHFYDITYQQGGGSQNLNDRFRPAYYQRSWDNGGNNVVYTKSNTDSDNYAYYIAADWSYVYNDVKKEYSNGAFSVLAETGFMGNGDAPADGKVLVRLPKADKEYTYFDVNSETGQKEADVLPIYTKNEDGSITLNQDANPSKLFTDKLKNASSFTQTITNETEGNNFFLVANPFMANMDMDEFFAANSANLEPKFWIMTANGQEVSVRTETGWVSTSDQVAALGKSAPLQGFFVKGKTNSKSVEITYTAAMQAESTATAPLQARPMAASSAQTLTIKAQSGDIATTAIVALRDKASNDFVSTEDCETFIDSNIADLPTIYTVASGQAMTVNSVPAIDMLPLGIVSETDDNVEVSFSGFEGTLYLYDAQLKTTQTLTEGMTVAMPTNTSGRYFITVDPSTTGITTTTTAETSNRKGVWTLSGKYCGTAVKNLAPGVYVVDGVKMVVR